MAIAPGDLIPLVCTPLTGWPADLAANNGHGLIEPGHAVPQGGAPLLAANRDQMQILQGFEQMDICLPENIVRGAPIKHIVKYQCQAGFIRLDGSRGEATTGTGVPAAQIVVLDSFHTLAPGDVVRGDEWRLIVYKVALNVTQGARGVPQPWQTIVLASGTTQLPQLHPLGVPNPVLWPNVDSGGPGSPYWFASIVVRFEWRCADLGGDWPAAPPEPIPS